MGIGKTLFGDKKTTTRLRLDPEGATERAAREEIDERFSQLSDLVDVGPGEGDITSGLEAQRGLGDLLQQLTETGGLPSEQDIAGARQLASDIFAGQRAAIGGGS